MAERVLVISKVNAVFVVAVPTKLCVKKIHEKQKNSENMETIYLQVNYRDFYIALFHSCERLTKVCAYFSTTKKKEREREEKYRNICFKRHSWNDTQRRLGRNQGRLIAAHGS